MHFSVLQALSSLLLVLALQSVTATAEGSQKVLLKGQGPGSTTPRKLHGRFLHITDIHPDPFYVRNASAPKPHVCHRGHGRAGNFGAETSDCDSPLELAHATFKWIKENLKDEIDFVVWTGDNARHDNDNRHPRTEKAIYDLNKQMVDLMTKTFHKPDDDDDDDPTNDFVVPIIPTIGNNDIFPHNVFQPGPSSVTRTYLDMWRHFVPEEEHHIFERGAYFMVEVIPNRLAVFSLNTMYFFRSNGAVDGCKRHSEPGYAQFEWLRIQLQLIRERNMKAILIGHVPPAWTKGKKNWEKSCWEKFAIWTYRYRDILVGNVFGHMNIDHFILTDTKGPVKRLKGKQAPPSLEKAATDAPDDEITIQSPESYLTDLREVFSHVEMPPKMSKNSLDSDGDDDEEDEDDNEESKKDILSRPLPSLLNIFAAKEKDKFGKRYTLSFVSPSVIPNFFPTVRVLEYNIDGVTDAESYALPAPPLGAKEMKEIKETSKQMVDLVVLLDDIKRKFKHTKESKSKEAVAAAASDIKPTAPKKKPHDIPRGPPKGAGLGPAYKVQPFTLMGYTQYFANLTRINGWVPKEKEEKEKSRKGKSKGKGGKGRDDDDDPSDRNPPEDFRFEVEYHTSDKPYKLKDLTVRNYMILANKISQGVKKSIKSQEVCEEPLEFIDYAEGRGPQSLRMNSRVTRYGPEAHAFTCRKPPENSSAKSSDLISHELDLHQQGDKKKKKKKNKNKMWHTFFKRAVVGSVDDEDLKKMDFKHWPLDANEDD